MHIPIDCSGSFSWETIHRPVEIHRVRCSSDLYSVQTIDEVLDIHLNGWSIHFTLAEAEALIAKLQDRFTAQHRRVIIDRSKDSPD